jgi:hypothetical protein
MVAGVPRTGVSIREDSNVLKGSKAGKYCQRTARLTESVSADVFAEMMKSLRNKNLSDELMRHRLCTAAGRSRIQ